jgi:thiol-disulfide isomerase/thioredoxin
MAMARVGTRTLATLLLWAGAGSALSGAEVSQLLSYKPKQASVPYSTPAAAEIAGCKVELAKGAGGASAWVLRDARGQVLRRFADTNGDKQIDMWSYYQDGQETYREVDSNFDQKIDQYRWLGAGGSRIGVSSQQDGRIDSWQALSHEELSQEVLQAVITRDTARFQALLVSEADLRELGLPASEAGRIRDSVAAAPAKFQKTVAGLIGLTEKTQWMHVETKPPQTIPADAIGAKADFVHYAGGSMLYSNGQQHDWLQTGEMVLVGKVWKVIDAPLPGYEVQGGSSLNGGGASFQVSAELKPLLEELKAVDAVAPNVEAGNANAKAVADYNMKRAAVLEKIVAQTKGEQRANWVRQVADCLSAAAQNSAPGDTAAYDAVVALRDRTAKEAPGSNIAAYVTFREMSAEYAGQLAKPKANMTEVQEKWRERLKKYAEEYPSSEDTPDALLQLGMVSEFMGKETEAKNHYATLAQNFAKHPLAAKAQGAIKRLSLEGQPLDLAGPQLGNASPFELASLKGKAVVVYYWASWNAQCESDFGKLKGLLNTYGPKGVELVCVNLDNAAGAAQAYLQRVPVPGTHLYQQPGGLESPLAVNYGVMVLPHLFLVGKDGKVVSRTVQIGSLEDELKKLTDK